MGGVLRVPQVVQREVGRDDQRLAAAVTAVNHIENLFQPVLGAALHAEVVKDKQRIAAKAGNVLVAPLKAGGKVIEDKSKVRHADGDFFLHEGVCDTACKVAFAGAYAAPEQAADIVCPHIFPMLHIPAGKPGLRVPAVVVLESPVPHGGVGKAPAFQFFHGVKVPAPLFGGLPFLAGGSLAVALCRVAVAAKDSGLIRRKIGFFRLAALAAVQ